jgi:hyperosmotically inducible protein
MKSTVYFAALLLACTGCNKPSTSSSEPPRSNQAARDDTGVNARDRDAATVTPLDQKENQSDIDITANIRKRLVATKLSVDAQNAKIVTRDGKVTLRGPVKTATEKQQLEQIAQEVAGASNVDSQLEVQP